MINLIKEWIFKIHNYDSLFDDYEDVILANNLLSQNLQECQQKVKKAKNLPSVHDREYWNKKWKWGTVYYSAPIRKKVLEYVTHRNINSIRSISQDIIRDFGLSRTDIDSVPISVLKWLQSNFKSRKFKYVLDKGEQWFTPEETLQKKEGDCDDWGILEYFIIRDIFMQLGIWEKVKHRLKCVAGNVNVRGSIPSSAGGHFYLIWLHSDREWYVIESTYYRPMAITNYAKKPMKLNSMYGTIWFTFTEDHSFSQHSITVSKDDFEKLS